MLQGHICVLAQLNSQITDSTHWNAKVWVKVGGQYRKEWQKCISRGSHTEVSRSNRVPPASPFFACEELRSHCRSRLGRVPAVDLLIRPALTETRWTTTPTNTCDGRWERDKGRDTPPPDHQRGPACSAGARSGLQASACWGIQTCAGLIYDLHDLESKSSHCCTNTHAWAQCVACDAWSCDTREHMWLMLAKLCSHLQ